jgi:hypothetical protein
MGDLKRAAKRTWSSMWEGSKKIAEKLGYESAGVTPPSKDTLAARAEPPVAPMPDDEELGRARRRRLAGSAGRTGRASTILSDDDRLGP